MTACMRAPASQLPPFFMTTQDVAAVPAKLCQLRNWRMTKQTTHTKKKRQKESTWNCHKLFFNARQGVNEAWIVHNKLVR
jgi:hypothetical protein